MQRLDKLLFSRHEAAAALGVCLSPFDVMTARGWVRAAHFGRRVLVHRDEIERAARRIANGKTLRVWPEKRGGKTVRGVA